MFMSEVPLYCPAALDNARDTANKSAHSPRTHDARRATVLEIQPRV